MYFKFQLGKDIQRVDQTNVVLYIKIIDIV